MKIKPVAENINLFENIEDKSKEVHKMAEEENPKEEQPEEETKEEPKEEEKKEEKVENQKVNVDVGVDTDRTCQARYLRPALRVRRLIARLLKPQPSHIFLLPSIVQPEAPRDSAQGHPGNPAWLLSQATF